MKLPEIPAHVTTTPPLPVGARFTIAGHMWSRKGRRIHDGINVATGCRGKGVTPVIYVQKEKAE